MSIFFIHEHENYWIHSPITNLIFCYFLYLAGNPECPVTTFEKYISKLHPENPNFWQRPQKKYCKDMAVWYDNSPLGKNTLNNFMSNLSKDAGLSVKYTNHCIRATCITTLDHQGVEARHIMGVSGHKSENSIRSYSERLSENKKRQISDILSENKHVIPVKSLKSGQCHGNAPSSSTRESETVSNTAPVPCFPDFLGDDDFDKVLSDITAYEINNQLQTSNIGTKNFNFNNCNVNFHLK